MKPTLREVINACRALVAVSGWSVAASGTYSSFWTLPPNDGTAASKQQRGYPAAEQLRTTGTNKSPALDPAINRRCLERAQKWRGVGKSKLNTEGPAKRFQYGLQDFDTYTELH